ncbi:hypothetical protein DIU31_021680 [Mucilaginibacter rubeus]|uniref:Uncharacterized protein n=1 Tax=Mucilaginibacter rubeus TaxID=2027860 RepID=A0AAE6MK98_9SPHI|nr:MULTISPECIES: hypothetical protein [Mucilaginibacter]QEM05992.1 hypothetical protein DIU31_021680 [Mucilaginibacter rubeus]QEM18573.1 hypothetical protein DIU38_021905 [Mucilaginibacter gossypii]QTE44885.1 hypothetical protein J3L19_05815 [Mucilaginibacter rubeus]QTE51483.1 hypothetical protein J3L21_05790 [Mucilaginibacter rubeus]QTE56569.1 hypothetical protein J3L23_31035 [Mucilaginibacter rubeus]
MANEFGNNKNLSSDIKEKPLLVENSQKVVGQKFEEDADVQFLPEGGTFRTGLKSLVLLKLSV